MSHDELPLYRRLPSRATDFSFRASYAPLDIDHDRSNSVCKPVVMKSFSLQEIPEHIELPGGLHD